MLADSGTGTQPRRQASPDRDAGCGQASAGRASAKPVPHASMGLRIRGARDQARRRKRNYRPRRITGQQPEGSRRLASRPVSPGGCVAFSWRVPGGLRPGEQKGALPEPYGRQIRGLALFAPVAGERQLRPRSHGRGHAVHPFITPPHRMLPALEPRTSCPATWSSSSTSLSVICPVPGSRAPTRPMHWNGPFGPTCWR